MLRRVTRLVRRGMLLVGLLVVVAIPVSFLVGIAIGFPWPKRSAIVSDGFIGIEWMFTDLPGDRSVEVEIATRDSGWFFQRSSLRRVVWPSSRIHTASNYALLRVTLPLWLLAFICLAWPVTSFILARRRHKRGFPVEPKGGGESVSPPDSSS